MWGEETCPTVSILLCTAICMTVLPRGPCYADMMDAQAENAEAELARYAGVLERYPRDIQLLGLGTNGHIGANEPGTPFDSSLFVADSFASTIEATQKLFHLKREETPFKCIPWAFRRSWRRSR